MTMEYENLFVSSRWEIIELLSKEALSPLQISEKLNTSVANISQQLRLLEMGGIVTTKRIKNRDKGKPRTMYSLSANFLYVVSINQGFAKKQLITADDNHRAISNILTIKDANMHYGLLKLFITLETHLKKISALAYDAGATTLLVFPKPNSTPTLPKSYTLAYNSSEITVQIKIMQRIPAQSDLVILYDPENLFLEKGGKNNE